MRFLIDAQLPPALCGWFEARGHEAVHVSAIGMVGASDTEIAARRGGWRLSCHQGRGFPDPAPP